MTTSRHDTPTEELTGPDPVVAGALGSLDPGLHDAGYWHRFHRHVMAGVGRELARRRMMADVTMSDVIAGWSRTLVPSALMAAAVAAFMLLGTPPSPAPGPLALEEILRQSSDGLLPIPPDDETPSEASSFLLAAQEY